MRLITMDTSTKKSGIAAFENGKLLDYTLINYEKIKDVDERINLMGADILKYLIKMKPESIYIEHPQGHGKNVSMVGKLCEIIGIVRAYAIQKKIDFHEVMPSQWRAWAEFPQGKKERNELKEMSINFVKENFGIDVTDDEADSIAIGCGVLRHFELLEGK